MRTQSQINNVNIFVINTRY